MMAQRQLRQVEHPVDGSDARPVAPLRCYSFLPDHYGFLDDVRAGLSMRYKVVPPRWSFDAEGQHLYAVLAQSPEFYAQRCELDVINSHAAELFEFVGPHAQLIGIGAGGMASIRCLVAQLQPALYLQVDVDASATRLAAASFAAEFSHVNIVGIIADSTNNLVLPGFVGVSLRRKAVFIPGWPLGCVTSDELFATLQQARHMVGAGGILLAGVGLKKLRKVLDASCNDAAGAMAAFNAHVMTRINTDLGADIQVHRFRHLAFYDEVKGRVEMFMESQFAQFAHVAGQRYDFDAGEAVLTGIMCKYTDEEFLSLAGEAGFVSEKIWTDATRQFSVHGMVAA